MPPSPPLSGQIRILALDTYNAADAAAIDGEFTIDSLLVVSASPTAIDYHSVAVKPYQKRYGDDSRLPADYLGDNHRAGFLAYIGGRPAGVLLLSAGWNRLASIDDIAVDRCQRRRGVASELLAAAESWARRRGLAGLRLETQNTNVAACRLYEHYGFTLGGFDRRLYAAFREHAGETALFWYLLFGE